MNTAVVPYSDMKSMARDIAQSGLFGMKNETQVLALMAIAQAEGRHPAIVARDYDIIQGRPAKKSEAMLRDFLAGGGKVEWHKMDDTCADATFSHAAAGTCRITWDMQRAATAGLTSKDMYKKYPRQMLRARVVSEGVRAVGPFATSGMYVPEEVRDLAPTMHVVPDPEAITVDRETGEIIEDKLSEKQVSELDALITEVGADKPKFLKYLRVATLAELPPMRYADAVAALEKKRKQA